VTKNLAAIDLGSNAIRMSVGYLTPKRRFKLLEKMREPIRLGAEVFDQGRLSPQTIESTVLALKKFKDRLSADTKVRAIGTSAIREAKNRDTLIQRIREETGIEVQIISGDEEGRLIHLAIDTALELDDRPGMVVDIGGGSVEFVLFENHKTSRIQSFPLGTVRTIMAKQGDQPVSDSAIREKIFMHRSAIMEMIRKFQKSVEICVGTGGNFVALGQLRVDLLGKRNTNLIKKADIYEIIDNLMSLGYSGRIHKLGMRPDRADVILPAAFIVQLVFECVGLDEISVPEVGLREGIIEDWITQI